MAAFQNPIIIISGPAGVGKTTIAKALQQKHPEIEASVTYTTRPERLTAPEDKKIYYTNDQEFEQMIKQGEFLEWAKVHGKYYGTHREKTLEKLKTNPVIFNIDVQGAKQIFKEMKGEKIISIFLLPESIEQIKNHIIKRGHSEPDDLQRRLESAQKEISEQDLYTYKVINSEGKVNQAIERVEEIIKPYFAQKTSIFSKISAFFRN